MSWRAGRLRAEDEAREAELRRRAAVVDARVAEVGGGEAGRAAQAQRRAELDREVQAAEAEVAWHREALQVRGGGGSVCCALVLSRARRGAAGGGLGAEG